MSTDKKKLTIEEEISELKESNNFFIEHFNKFVSDINLHNNIAKEFWLFKRESETEISKLKHKVTEFELSYWFKIKRYIKFKWARLLMRWELFKNGPECECED